MLLDFCTSLKYRTGRQKHYAMFITRLIVMNMA